MDDECKQDLERVQKAIDILAEHFDSVQVFCTRHEGSVRDGTVEVSLGTGNWFARWGQVIQWVTIESGRMTEHGAKYNREKE